MNAVAGKLYSYGQRRLRRSSSTTTQRMQQHLPQIIPTNGVPIHLYADEIEPQAMAQIKLLAESPIPVDYVSGKGLIYVASIQVFVVLYSSLEYDI